MASTYLSVAILAVEAKDMLDAGKQVGTANNQVILGCLVIVLIFVVLYRERQQNRQHEEQKRAHKESADKAEEAIKEANRKQEDAVILAEKKFTQAMVDASKERNDLYSRMEKQNDFMNQERQQRWTMLIDVVRENTTAFRGVRETLDSLQRYLINEEAKRI